MNISQQVSTHAADAVEEAQTAVRRAKTALDLLAGEKVITNGLEIALNHESAALDKVDDNLTSIQVKVRDLFGAPVDDTEEAA